jgi:hypothetical protein
VNATPLRGRHVGALYLQREFQLPRRDLTAYIYRADLEGEDSVQFLRIVVLVCLIRLEAILVARQATVTLHATAHATSPTTLGCSAGNTECDNRWQSHL